MANEKRLIDAKDAAESLCNKCCVDRKECDRIGFCADYMDIMRITPVNAKPVVHGRWIYVDGKGTNAEYECNKCHKHVCFDEKIDGSIPAYKFCHHCGSQMDGGDEDG